MGARLQERGRDLHLKVDRLAEEHLLIAKFPPERFASGAFRKAGYPRAAPKGSPFSPAAALPRPDLHFAERRAHAVVTWSRSALTVASRNSCCDEVATNWLPAAHRSRAVVRPAGCGRRSSRDRMRAGQRFALVMRDVDGGDPQVALQPLSARAHASRSFASRLESGSRGAAGAVP